MTIGSGRLYAYGKIENSIELMLFSPVSTFDRYEKPQIIVGVMPIRTFA